MSQPARHRHVFGFGDCAVDVSEYQPPFDYGDFTLVFLHGRFGSGEGWSPVVEDLSRHYRCLVPDLPGFANSYCTEKAGLSLPQSAQLLGKLIARFSPGPVILIGHDLGGAVAQLCMLHEPERVEGLVLINSAGLLGELRRVPSGVRGAWFRWKLSRMAEPLGVQVGGFEAIARLEESWPEELIRQRGLAAAGIRWPVMLLWGSLDSINPLEDGARLYRELREEAHFFQHDDCGHWPFLQAPDWVAAKMRDFLQRRRGRQPERRAA